MDHAAAASHGVDLVQVVALLAAAIVFVPLFKKLGLGSVLGYLAAGLVVGPFGLKLVTDPQSVLHTAELGVVMFLFIIGLEMEPSKLWNLRKQIFGLGIAQVMVCSAALTVVGHYFGFSWRTAFVAGAGFVLTSTAIVMQVLQERAELGTDRGEKVVSVLLLEDLAIVPLLAIVALLAPPAEHEAGPSRFVAVGIALAALLGLTAVGRYLLNPFFKVLADSKAREIMTGAALLVILGAALAMQLGGLSMAMGAFLAGVLLSTSTFRHQLEADVEPFRGLLLGLFFLAVGSALDVRVIAENGALVASLVATYMVVKSIAIYGIARALGSAHGEALDRAVLMSQGGEFAFVLYSTAAGNGILDARTNAIFTATVILSMALTPLALVVFKRFAKADAQSLDGVTTPDGLRGRILLIGFGRFGQLASQGLIAKRCQISIIDANTDMVRAAARFGFKVYYGDGTRLDILHAAGIEHVDAVLVCVENPKTTNKIVELIRHEYPLVKVMARAFDRGHALSLVKAGVHYQMREVFESSLAFGREALITLGTPEDEADEIIAGVRDRDTKRFELQLVGDESSGRDLLLSNAEDTAEEQGIQTPANVDDALPIGEPAN